MPIRVRCQCGKTLTARDDLAGQTLPCPACRVPVTVPLELPDPDAVGLQPDNHIPEIRAVEVLDDEEEGTYEVKGVTGGGLASAAVTGELGRIRLDAPGVDRLAYSADHAWAVAADADALHLLDLRAQKRAGRLRKHRDPITCLEFSSDGRLFLSGDDDGGLLVWDVARWQPRRWLEGHRRAIRALAFAPDGRHAVSGGEDGALRLWDATTGEAIPLFEARGDEAVNCVAFSPDGKLVFGLGDEGRARLWSFRTGEPLRRLQDGEPGLRSATFGRGGDFLLAAADRSFDVCKWDVRTGRRVRCFRHSEASLARVTRTLVAPGGGRLLTVGDYQLGGKVLGDPGLTIVITPDLVTGLAASALGTAAGMAGAMALSGVPGRSHFYLQFWDALNESPLQTVDCGRMSPGALAVSPDGLRALVAFADGTVRVFGL